MPLLPHAPDDVTAAMALSPADLAAAVQSGTLGRGELLCIVVRRCLDEHVLGGLSSAPRAGLSERQLLDVTALVTLFGQACLPAGPARTAFADAGRVATVPPPCNRNPGAASPCGETEDMTQHATDQHAWYTAIAEDEAPNRVRRQQHFVKAAVHVENDESWHGASQHSHSTATAQSQHGHNDGDGMHGASLWAGGAHSGGGGRGGGGSGGSDTGGEHNSHGGSNTGHRGGRGGGSGKHMHDPSINDSSGGAVPLEVRVKAAWAARQKPEAEAGRRIRDWLLTRRHGAALGALMQATLCHADGKSRKLLRVIAAISVAAKARGWPEYVVEHILLVLIARGGSKMFEVYEELVLCKNPAANGISATPAAWCCSPNPPQTSTPARTACAGGSQGGQCNKRAQPSPPPHNLNPNNPSTSHIPKRCPLGYV